MEEGEDSVLREFQESVDSHPDDPSLHFNLALYLWENGKELKQIKEKAAEHFVISAKLNPQNASAFRYLGDYYSQLSLDTPRALKCYQRALSLSPDDPHCGESICDLLDKQGKESLEIAVCRDASEKSPRAFWAFRRLGYLQLHQKKWSVAVQSLQHAIRGYPTSADLWEALGLAYQQLGMLTAAIKVVRELSGLILTRGPKLCNFVEWRGFKVVYKRYASLYFCMCINQDDNELEILEIIHHFVEILDRYFGSVCELDLIFNFHKAYYILDEILIAGELQESSKKTVARLIAAQDSLVEAAKEQANSVSYMISQATK